MDLLALEPLEQYHGVDLVDAQFLCKEFVVIPCKKEGNEWRKCIILAKDHLNDAVYRLESPCDVFDMNIKVNELIHKPFGLDVSLWQADITDEGYVRFMSTMFMFRISNEYKIELIER